MIKLAFWPKEINGNLYLPNTEMVKVLKTLHTIVEKQIF